VVRAIAPVPVVYAPRSGATETEPQRLATDAPDTLPT
jgi:hypothetical protein